MKKIDKKLKKLKKFFKKINSLERNKILDKYIDEVKNIIKTDIVQQKLEKIISDKPELKVLKCIVVRVSSNCVKVHFYSNIKRYYKNEEDIINDLQYFDVVASRVHKELNSYGNFSERYFNKNHNIYGIIFSFR